ncbi:MAG: hypothetical protein QOG87_125 [Actinomycetota bacterium]|jgi:hypothetical protein
MFPAMQDRSVPELDDVTADRLLDGAVAPDDAPPGYQDAARALHATALLASETPTRDGTTAVAAFLDAIPTRRTTRMKKWKIAAATLAGGLTLSTGLAAADVLPGPAQDVASSALSRVGINVPDGNDGSTNVSTKKEPKAEKVKDDTSPSTTHPENHGSVVSDVAHDESNVGADHGAAVCTTASDGKCKAGETHGSSSTNSRSGAGSSNSSSNSSSTNGGSSNSSGSSANSGASTDGGASTSTGSSNSSGSSGSSSSSGGGSSSNSGSTSGSSGSSTNSSGSSSGG